MRTLLLFLLLAAVALRPARAQSLTAEWAVPCATNGQPYSLVTDAQGNSYVAGTFGGTITLGSTTLTANQIPPGYNGPQDVFLAKLDPQGQYVWAMQFGDGQNGFAHVGAVDNLGNLYVSGSFRSYSLQLGAGGPTLYNASNAAEGFVARFSAQTGQCQWARRFGGTGDDYAGALVLHAGGDIFLTGRTGSGDADLGPYTLPATPLNRGERPFLARLSPDGIWRWAQPIGSFPPSSYGKAYVFRPQLDGLGNLYLTGTFSTPSLTFGTTTLTTTPVGVIGADIFITKYTEDGRLRWARQASPGGTNGLSGGAAYYDGQGHLYFAGYFESRSVQLGPIPLTNVGPLVPDPQPIPAYPNTTRYFSDAFLARYDTAGTWQWATRRGDYNTGETAGIFAAADRLYEIYRSGYDPPLLAVLDPATGTWGPEYALPPFPTWVSPASDQLGRLYLFGSFTGSSLNLGGQTIPGVGGTATTGYVARLGSLALATKSATLAGPRLQAWPTPGPGTGVWVQGAPAGQVVEVLDVLGRKVGGGLMPASGPLRLSWDGAGLAPGVYVLRSGGQSCRWVVE